MGYPITLVNARNRTPMQCDIVFIDNRYLTAAIAKLAASP